MQKAGGRVEEQMMIAGIDKHADLNCRNTFLQFKSGEASI
jgi:hypothetical protein